MRQSKLREPVGSDDRRELRGGMSGGVVLSRAVVQADAVQCGEILQCGWAVCSIGKLLGRVLLQERRRGRWGKCGNAGWEL